MAIANSTVSGNLLSPVRPSLIEEIVYRLSIRHHRADNQSELSHRPATFSMQAYSGWRTSGLRKNFDRFFSPAHVAGKCVLDFGCGGGELSFMASEYGAGGVIGTDLNARFVKEAIARNDRANVEFRHETDDTRISLPDGSVDAILCFDVVEHIMSYREIFREWRRVLAPGGKVLIWWSVWWHPYGHHLQTMIPLPWIHAFMSDRSMLDVAARVYDSPRFQPRFWHFDEAGAKLPNPYRGAPFSNINKLTIPQFDREVGEAGLGISRKEVIPFGGSPAPLKRLLSRILPDAFCACTIYELTRPDE